VQDAYEAMKRLVSKRLAGRRSAEVALIEYEVDPQTWERPLAKALAESGAADDEAVVVTAQQLMGLVDAAGTAAGKYTVDLRAARNVQVGDGNQQFNL
jgi:hypothetical protein